MISSTRHAELVLQPLQQLEDLRLDGHVERGGRLVGDEQRRAAGERHRDHHPLSHATRELVRILGGALLRGGDAHLPEQFDGARARFATAPCARAARRTSAICSPQVKTGFRELIGSWKTMEISRPRTRRIPAGGSASRSRPWKITRPSTIFPAGSGTSRRIESAVTLLPLPDSPTSASVSPARTSKRDAVHRAHHALVGA